MKLRIASAYVTLGLLLATGCGPGEPVLVQDNIPAAYIDADGTHEGMTRDTLRNPYPHLKLTGGAISLNDRCPVRKAPLNRRLPTLFVNGKPIGFC
jgi:hypothetical protein